MQFVVESTCIAYRIATAVPPPQRSYRCMTIGTVGTRPSCCRLQQLDFKAKAYVNHTLWSVVSSKQSVRDEKQRDELV